MGRVDWHGGLTLTRPQKGFDPYPSLVVCPSTKNGSLRARWSGETRSGLQRGWMPVRAAPARVIMFERPSYERPEASSSGPNSEEVTRRTSALRRHTTTFELQALNVCSVSLRVIAASSSAARGFVASDM
jgi:hypothetical protein